MICIGAGDGLEMARGAVRLASTYPNVWATVGIHPHDAGKHTSLDELEELITHPKVVAIGETGLDFFRDWSPFDKQFELFRKDAAALRAGGKILLPEAATLLATADTALARDEAAAFEKLGQIERAAEALRPVVAEQPQDFELAIRYANLLLQAGRTDEALAAAQRIESDDEKVIWLLFSIYDKRGEADKMPPHHARPALP